MYYFNKNQDHEGNIVQTPTIINDYLSIIGVNVMIIIIAIIIFIKSTSSIFKQTFINFQDIL